MRWSHPSRGMVAPDDFHPPGGGIRADLPIGRWVLQPACERAPSWRRPGREIGMSVNVSAYSSTATTLSTTSRHARTIGSTRLADARDHRDHADARRRRRSRASPS